MNDKTLLIFDCDGTLVNTEYMSAYSYAKALHQFSDDLKKYDEHALEDEFKGMKIHKSAEILIKRYDLQVNVQDIVDEFMRQISLNRADKQQIIPGVKDSLALLKQDGRFEFCVASNGEHQNIVDSLIHAGLYEFFAEDRIFNASMVAEPKPSPLLFIHAAKTAGYSIENSCVIEDTPLGTQAGKSGGFFVYGFTGCIDKDHQKEAEIALYKKKADKVFNNFLHIADNIIEEKTKSYLMSA